MIRALVLFAALGLLVACTRSDAIVEPVWGKQPCGHCAMILSDKRFGAELVTREGDRFYFDDVGCMVLFLEERRLQPAHAWVHDALTGQWLDAASARYAPASASPMDFGFEGRASEGISWDEMRAHVLAKKRSAS